MEDAASAIARKRRRRRMVALFVLVVFPLMLVGAVFFFLESAPGRALLRTQVLRALDGALAGKLEAEQIELNGSNHVVLVNVKLFTPEGELVASLARLEADVELGALARQRVNLSQVRVETPQLFLTQDERGWNLVRATATKKSSKPDAAGGPNPWRVSVDDLELTDGLFDLKQEGRRITATKLSARGDAEIRVEPLEVTGALELSSALTAPLEETLHAKLGGTTTTGPQAYDAQVTLGGSKVQGQIELPSLGITVDELVAAPRELSAFIPGWPIRPVVYGKGSLHPHQAALQLSAGKARLTVEAKYDLSAHSASALTVKGEDVDLAELLGAAMPSDLAFEATGALTDWRPDTLSGNAEAKATWDAKGGQRLFSAQAAVTAEKGSVRVKSLTAASPGLDLTARGTLTRTSATAFGTITAKDLSQVSKTLEAFANVDVGGLGGNGVIRVSLHGPWRGPSAKLVGQLNAFSIGGARGETLTLNADVADLSRPLELSVLLHAKKLTFGERAFEDVSFDVITHGRELDLNLATRGMGDLRLHALALLDKDSLGMELQTTELTSADSKWLLESPTRLSWARGLSLSPFSLRDGEQRISGELELTKTRLDAKAMVQGVDLARLPRLLAVPSWQLAGTLSGDLVVTGKPNKPELVVNAQLTRGKVRGFDELDVTLNGSWIDQRAKGKVNAKSGLGSLEGTFDLPVFAFLDEKPGQGTAHFTLKDFPARELERQLERELPFDGSLSARLDVSGSGDRPDVRLTVRSDGVMVTQSGLELAVKPLEVSVFTTEDSTLTGTAHFKTMSSDGELTLTTPLTIASLRKKLPSRDEVLALPVTLAVGVRRLELTRLGELGLEHSDELGGLVSLSANLKGTAKAPTGEATFTLENVTYPPFQHGNARLTVRTEDDKTRLGGTASLGDQRDALEVNVSVQALPEQALTALLGTAQKPGDLDAVVAALKDSPLNVLLTLRPFPLAAALATREKAPGGQLSATLEASGTLEAPNLRLKGAVKDVKFDRVVLGSGRFDVKSTGNQQSLTLALGGEGRDDFKAKGTMGLDLRLSSLRHGLQWRKAPLDVSLESRNFDVGFLSGATELVRVVAGRVDLSGRVFGELGDPSFRGDAEVRDGRIALAGYGDYRAIGLQLHAANDLVELKKLEASSGAGKLELVAKGVRQKTGVFLLTSTGSSDKFPIVIDDQLQATATLKYELEGDATSSLIDIQRLMMPRVDVALPEVKRKDLQDLERPPDILVIRPGSRALRKKKQAQDAVSGGAAKKPFVVRALIDAARNIWVRSSDVNVELGLSEDFRVEYNEGLRLFGDARVIRGSVEVIGREFTVQKDSHARFAGPASQPYVNVSALHVNTREQVKITVAVQGKGTDLSIKASSEPPMPESDIYAVLATGRRNLKTSGGATLTPGQAASVVGQLAASQLKTVIAKKLPIDVFNFDTSDNFEKFKLDVGKYLSDTIYLGGSVDIGARRERGENVWAGRIELQLTRQISLEAYAGDALSFGADAMWSRDF